MAASTDTAVATKPPTAISKGKRDISELLRGPELREAVSAALPRHLTPERFIRVAITATMRQPDLLKCTRESFFRALLDLSAMGLEPDGRRAHLIPYRNNKQDTTEVQLIVDYKGIVDIVRRSGEVSYIHADVVREGDKFEFTYGSDARLIHRPDLASASEKVVAIYSFVKMKDGSEDFLVMSRAEVERIRKRSRSSGSGPWVSDWDEMAKKTAFRRHSKWLPFSSETRDAIEKDDEFSGSAATETGLAPAPTIDLSAFSVSSDENRGHDAANPDQSPAGNKRDRAKEYDEFPDAFEFQAGEKIYVGGKLYAANAELTGWVEVVQKP